MKKILYFMCILLTFFALSVKAAYIHFSMMSSESDSLTVLAVAASCWVNAQDEAFIRHDLYKYYVEFDEVEYSISIFKLFKLSLNLSFEYSTSSNST